MLDVSKDGYYETQLCLEDFENVRPFLRQVFLKTGVMIHYKFLAVELVKFAFGGKYKPIFLVDNSPIHKWVLKYCVVKN